MPAHATDSRSDRHALARLVAPLVAVLMFAGVGALGWLVGHVLTYDAIGASHLHVDHGYMQPVGHGGSWFVGAGVALALVALVVGRRGFTRWVRTTLHGDAAYLAWVGAALVPATTFWLVELAEGSVAQRGGELLLVGMPVQVLIGVLVLWLVRELLGVLVDVAERLVTPHASPVRTPAAPLAASLEVLVVRRSPMATSAPRRGPPPRMP